MRSMVAISLILASAACNAKSENNAATGNGTESIATMGTPVTLTASDGVKVFGTAEKAAHPKALILLFHQAGSSKDEYGSIAPRLAQEGYSSLAIDQRSGGSLFGPNQTVRVLGKSTDYLDAQKDLQAALDWARQQELPIILWGSSYSSSLIFPLAAKNPNGIIALLSFSPGEYFDSDKHMIEAAAASVHVPVFIASTKDETGDADPIMAALPKTSGNVRFVPDHGVHGSSTLIAKRNPEGAEANWAPVLAFLNRVAPAR